MPELRHPETGEHVRASHATAEKLIADGYIEAASPEVSAVAEAEIPPADDADQNDEKGEPAGDGGSGGTPAVPQPEKPLDKMGLKELIAYGEQIQMPADQLDALRKPGTSKAKAMDAINAHIADQK